MLIEMHRDILTNLLQKFVFFSNWLEVDFEIIQVMY